MEPVTLRVCVHRTMCYNAAVNDPYIVTGILLKQSYHFHFSNHL